MWVIVNCKIQTISSVVVGPAILFVDYLNKSTQSATTCSKLTIEILEQGVKYIQN